MIGSRPDRRAEGLGTGSRLKVFEEADGLKLRVVRSVPQTDVPQLAGMVKARKRGVPRRLRGFHVASLLAKVRSGKHESVESGSRVLDTPCP